MPKYGFSLAHKVMIKNEYYFVIIVLCLRTHQRKQFYKDQLTYNGVTWLNLMSFGPCCHNWLACICLCACICLLLWIFSLACYRLCVERLPAFHWHIADIVENFGCIICRFFKFPRICPQFCLLIWYSSIRLIVLNQFGIWCYRMMFWHVIYRIQVYFMQ